MRVITERRMVDDPFDYKQIMVKLLQEMATKVDNIHIREYYDSEYMEEVLKQLDVLKSKIDDAYTDIEYAAGTIFKLQRLIPRR